MTKNRRSRAQAPRSRPAPRLLPEQHTLLPIVRAPWWQWLLPALLVAAAAVVAYWPTLDNGFVNWDDPDYLWKNDYVAEWKGLKRIWTPHPWEKHEQFYPMVFSTFWLEHKVGLWARDKDLSIDYDKLPEDEEAREFHAGDYHLTNMVLHAINSALVILLLRALGVTPWVAWWVAGLFALHPINVASVSWASERKNVLSGLFALLSLTLYIRDTRRSSWPAYVGCLVLYVFALLSKTAMVALPVIAMLCDRLVTGRWLQRTLVRVSPMLVLALLAAMVTTFNERASAKETMIALDVPLRPFAASGALWFYIWKMLVPVTFPGVYPRWDLAGSKALFIVALAALPVAAVIIWRLRQRLPGQVIWGLLFYVVSLGPMLGLISFNYTQFTFVADHFVYLASIGVFLGVATGVYWLGRRLGPGIAPLIPITLLACAVLTALGILTYRQNKNIWKNGKTFWSYTLEHNPLCWPGHYNIANIYRREWSNLRKQDINAPELLQKAAEHYRLAAVARTDLHQAHKNRGDTLATAGDYEGAAAAYRDALAVRPTASGYWQSLAGILERAAARAATDEERDAKWAEAEQAWRKVVEILSKRVDDTRLRPQQAVARAGLARVLERQHRYGEAGEAWQQALALDRQSVSYCNGLARCFEGQRKWAEAEQVWRRCLQIQPSEAGLHYRLGVAIHEQGRLQEAIYEYDQALQLNPDHAPARQKLQQAEQELQQ
ncbi:MAG TPA: tetratricopeptide repeat protein [Phycisphaerae bacterium]|nr:tetratricopeptide repeat protein [Phycisphaerae bacterium]